MAIPICIPKRLGQLISLRTLWEFYMWCEDGYKIGELGNLNLLRGNLEIRNLEKVTDRDEATSAELMKKQYLHSLILNCECKRKHEWRVIGDDEVTRMEGVFEGLGAPQANLKQLDVRYYTGSKFPSWMEESSFLSHLVRLDLFDCRNCRQLPTLGKLPSLKYLKILGFDAIERVGCEFFGNGAVPFPKLEQLKFSFMPNWEEWEFKAKDGVVLMPSLLDLSLLARDKLKSLPALGKLPSLKYLKIEACAPFELMDREFYANGSDNVMGVAFPKLDKLIFKHLRNWKDWELRVHDGETSMPHLCKLTISNCPVLMSLPCHLPVALRKFTIECCDELTWRPLPCHPIPHLEELILRGGQKEVLPGSWPYLPNLKQLDIEEAVSMTSHLKNRWEQLKSLHTFNIVTCCRLGCLPEGLGHLKSLLFLNITYRP